MYIVVRIDLLDHMCIYIYTYIHIKRELWNSGCPSPCNEQGPLRLDFGETTGRGYAKSHGYVSVRTPRMEALLNSSKVIYLIILYARSTV